MKGDTRRGFLFIFVCFLVLWGEGVRGQCPNDSDDIPFQFVGEGEPCEMFLFFFLFLFYFLFFIFFFYFFFFIIFLI